MVKLTRIGNDQSFHSPRRVLRYVVVWVERGSAQIEVDGTLFTLFASDVITITSGQVHLIKELHQAEGWILEFTLDFFCKDDRDIELVFENGLFCHFDENVVVSMEGYGETALQLQRIDEELKGKPFQYLASIHARIRLFLIGINRARVLRGDGIWKPDALFLRFLELVRANFSKHYPVSEFASMLGTTEARLNERSKAYTGKTAQNVVYSLLISEAKRRLRYEKVSVKEVAFSLGFQDPFYFSNFFKKHTGGSPSSFQSTSVH